MQEIIIDAEFKNLLPPLDEKTYALLEESLVQYGCVYPLILWENTIIDGHNRYEISQKHNIPINTVTKEFDSREQVIIWIISTQIARRNLTPMQLSYYRGLHYHTDKRIITDKTAEPVSKRLAEHYNVSSKTIERDARLVEVIDAIGDNSTEAKQEILSGRAGITRQHLRELASGGSEEDIKNIAVNIKEGTFEKPGRTVTAELVELPDDLPDESGKEEQSEIKSKKFLKRDIIKTAEEFSADVRLLIKNSGDTEVLKTMIREQIGKLEDLYLRIR